MPLFLLFITRVLSLFTRGLLYMLYGRLVFEYFFKTGVLFTFIYVSMEIYSFRVLFIFKKTIYGVKDNKSELSI